MGPTEVEVHVASATAAGCLQRGPVTGCALLATGAMAGKALNRQHGELGFTGFVGLGLRAGVGASITGPLSLRLDLEGVWSALPPTLYMRRPEFWRPFPLSLAAGTSLVWAIR